MRHCVNGLKSSQSGAALSSIITPLLSRWSVFAFLSVIPAGNLLWSPVCIYTLEVEIEFDAAKNARNIRERGLSFEMAAEFDFEGAVTHIEQRRGKNRVISVGYLGDRLHVICYLQTARGIRVISFRKANRREAMKYGKPKTLDR